MIQTTVKVSAWPAPCARRINDAICAAFSGGRFPHPIPKGETVILSKEPLGENALRAAINATGYMAERSAPQSTRRKAFPFREEETVGSFDAAIAAIGLTYIFYKGGQSL